MEYYITECGVEFQKGVPGTAYGVNINFDGSNTKRKSFMDCHQTCYGMEGQCDMFQFGNNTYWAGEKGGCVGEQPASISSSTVKGKGETCSLARIEEEPARGELLAWKDVCIRSICIFNLTLFRKKL